MTPILKEIEIDGPIVAVFDIVTQARFDLSGMCSPGQCQALLSGPFALKTSLTTRTADSPPVTVSDQPGWEKAKK